MKKPKISVIAAICMVIVCAIVAGCAATGPNAEKKPETKQTSYLPATYKYVGEVETYRGHIEATTIEKQFTYDDAGRCIQCTVNEVLEQREHLSSTYRYSHSTYEFSYDENGNLIRRSKDTTVKQGLRETHLLTTYTFQYTYNSNGQAERCVMERTSSFDDGETQSNETATDTYGFAYDKKGNLVALTVGTEDTCWYYYSYDKQGRMTAQTYCALLPETDPQSEQYKYRYTQIAYERDAQGKVTSTYDQHAHSTENVGAEGVDQLEYTFNVNAYTFYCDANGNLTGVKEPNQYHYDENGQWIPEEKHETVKYRGEEIDRLLARYTQDEQGNIIKFENYQYTEELTYTALELTPTQMAQAQRFFVHRNPATDVCELPAYVFGYFYPDWHPGGASYLNYFVTLFKNLPW